MYYIEFNCETKHWQIIYDLNGILITLGISSSKHDAMMRLIDITNRQGKLSCTE